MQIKWTVIWLRMLQIWACFFFRFWSGLCLRLIQLTRTVIQLYCKTPLALYGKQYSRFCRPLILFKCVSVSFVLFFSLLPSQALAAYVRTPWKVNGQAKTICNDCSDFIWIKPSNIKRTHPCHSRFAMRLTNRLSSYSFSVNLTMFHCMARETNRKT